MIREGTKAQFIKQEVPTSKVTRDHCSREAAFEIKTNIKDTKVDPRKVNYEANIETKTEIGDKEEASKADNPKSKRGILTMICCPEDTGEYRTKS